MRFSEDTPLWLKDKTGQEADPWQVIEIYEIEETSRCIVIWPPRFGKTWGMQAVCLKEIACNPYEKEMIFGPVQKQANNALKEELIWIEMSPILSSWISRSRGKRQLNETKYEFQNRSGAETFGIYCNFDSENATILRGEEWDDMDLEVWNNRVTQRGIRVNKSGLPLRTRLSGTIQFGNGPVWMYDNDASYKTITKFDVYDGIEFGIYNQMEIEEERGKKTKDEWLRIYLLKYPDTKNFIWGTSLKACLLKAIKVNYLGVEYFPGGSYVPRGTVYSGFDCGHSGEKKIHSVYRADFIEVIGETRMWLNGYEWESTTDPDLIIKEYCDLCQYYGCSTGYGDALQAAMIAKINDEMFNRGLIEQDRSEYPENKPSNWDKWVFAPQWNTGKAKYTWGSITKLLIDHKKLIIPYFERNDDRRIAKMAKRLRECLLNVRQLITNSAYPSLKIIDAEIGDDAFDSINMAVGCSNDRQVLQVDLSKVKFAGQQPVTAGLGASVVRELQSMGGGASFSDFGIN